MVGVVETNLSDLGVLENLVNDLLLNQLDPAFTHSHNINLQVSSTRYMHVSSRT